MENQHSSQHTFIVRLWREKSEGESTWRGSVERVQNGERVYFQSMAKLKDAIVRMLGERAQEGEDDLEN